ncbi:hypothetical protein [Steroidobacter sp.]|uniref:hypothetical protein n=1 Tax=Steroidobacter sp. TaxID=1978227 RepID=UPI001A620A3E|nr:hypothetical protein [Steroidobacter sp.]MBL8267638.1 hypothetical protein [Steroidobacter sp.]
MRRALLLMSLVATSTSTLAAEDIDPVDADFLEYLGTLEGDEDNWTLVEQAASKPAPASTSPAKAPATATESGKASKEAAKPAAEQR